MPEFGKKSRERLDTCHSDLQAICELVIEHYDFTVLEGHRSGDRQDELFRQGKSKLKAGQSKHNENPSRAVDIAPYPIDWDDRERFHLFAGFVIGIGQSMGIKLRWGGDWNMNFEVDDNNFDDFLFEKASYRVSN